MVAVVAGAASRVAHASSPRSYTESIEAPRLVICNDDGRDNIRAQ